MSLSYSVMKAEDYAKMHEFWLSIPGLGLNEADEQGKIKAYLLRNPEQSFICKSGAEIIGTIMCGNDGRRAFVYHLAVSPKYRRKGAATELVRLAVEKQKSIGIDKCVAFVLNENTAGIDFWARLGFAKVQEAGTFAADIH